MEKKFFEKPTIYVGNVSINVSNLEHSLIFYKEILGFKVLEQEGNRAVLTADGKKALLTLEQPENVTPKEARTTGLYHYAILLPNRADLSAFLRHFVQNGLAEKLRLGASDHGVSEAIYFSDLDGNGIEIAHDRASSEWKWTDGNVAMVTEALDADGLLAETDKPWNGMPEDTVIGHVHLHVSELEKTEEFYIKGLGLDLVTNYPGALFTSYNGYHHHIALNIWNGQGAQAPSKNSVGLNWYTLHFPNEEVRMRTIDNLKKINATVQKEADYYVTEDPSKNKIRLLVD